MSPRKRKPKKTLKRWGKSHEPHEARKAFWRDFHGLKRKVEGKKRKEEKQNGST